MVSFVAELLIFAILGIVIVAYSIYLLQMPGTRDAGILTIIFDFPALSRRVHPGLGVGSGIVKSLESQLPSFTSAAASFASVAHSVVSSAVAATQSDLSSMVPRNCSVGTRYFCVGFASSVNCSALPLNISGHVANALNSPHLENYLASLDEKLKYVTPGFIEGPLVLGIASIGISLALLVPLVRCLFWRKEPIYHLWGLPFEVVLGIIGVGICLACSIYLPIALSMVTSKVEHLQFKVEKGNLMDGSILILSIALAMTFCVGSVCFRNLILPKITRKIWKRADPQPQRDRFDNYTSYTNNYGTPIPPESSHRVP